MGSNWKGGGGKVRDEVGREGKNGLGRDGKEKK